MDRAERTAFISFLTHAGLAALTASLAFLSGSAAVLAVLLLVSAGLAASGLAWAGRLASYRSRSPLSPLLWNLALAAVGVGILSTAAAVAGASASRSIDALAPALAGCAVAAAVLAALARREQTVGRETDSRGLMASGTCSWLSAAGAAIAAAALAAERGGVPLDRVASLAGAALAGVTGVGVLAGALRGLLTGRPVEGVFPVRIGRGRAADARAGGRTLGWRVRRAGDEIVHPAHRWRTACAAAAVALGAWALTTICVVRSDQVALVSGRGVVREAGPGLLVTLPWPIDRVERSEAGGVLRSSIGGDAPAPSKQGLAGGPSRVAASLGVPARETALARPSRVERTFLTGDGQLVVIEATAHYRVVDHARFRASAADPEAVVSNALESVVVAAAASHPLDGLVAGDGRDIEEAARLDLTAALDALALGVDVLGVQMVRVLPPEGARGGLGAPATARDEAERTVIGETERAALSLSAARLEAFETVASAKRYAAERTRLARRDASRFTALATARRSGGAVADTRLVFETIEALLAGREKWILGNGTAVDGLDPAPCDSALSLERAWPK